VFGLLALLIAISIAACSTAPGDYIDRWFGSGPALAPAELVTIKPGAAVKVVWRGSAGDAEKYVFTPVSRGDAIYTAGAAGQITRFEASSGKMLARFDTKYKLSGGVGSDGRVIVVGTPRGEVLAFDATGKPLWQAQLTSEVLSAPQIDQGLVVVRSGDGRIYGLDIATGQRRWLYQRTLPALTVRTSVGVILYRGAVFAGFPGGRLVALTLENGNVGWDVAVALPKGSTELERVADISSSPIIDDRQLCAAAFQGRVACFEIVKGALLWSRDISSISGLAMDARNVYVTDEKSALIAYDKTSGASVWKQDKLYGRNISTPVVAGRYVAVGDYQGYVHILSRDDGSFVGRIATDGSAIVASPQMAGDNILVQTRSGGVFAIRIE
jgi:outer membrane protein assembly factor BamB